ncbi:hypothetical protein L1987_49961 [Smallanthus sonchifolius]|uniref:Uncharacterized protein n=1 Tax=Smallanthus sonchifolius TaxID=185202 RepID=A0ACB9FVZ7_9ASTR|nr:hypothetical protein L1987_49961 [Smallanthus sonchifolius]
MGSVVPQFLLIGFVLFNFLDNVNAGVTSSFIRSEWPSVDIPLDNEVFAVPSGYNAPEQVHITQGDYDGKAVMIIWVTPVEPGSNQNEVVPFKQYLYRYPTPYAASESSSPLWYAVRRASAHIIVLSSYSPFEPVLLFKGIPLPVNEGITLV